MFNCCKKTSVIDRNKQHLMEKIAGVERDIAALELQEEDLVAEIKKAEETGNKSASRSFARQVVHVRRSIAKLRNFHAQLSGYLTRVSNSQASATHEKHEKRGQMGAAGKYTSS